VAAADSQAGAGRSPLHQTEITEGYRNAATGDRNPEELIRAQNKIIDPTTQTITMKHKITIATAGT
jgi:hypothetical protein